MKKKDKIFLIYFILLTSTITLIIGFLFYSAFEFEEGGGKKRVSKNVKNTSEKKSIDKQKKILKPKRNYSNKSTECKEDGVLNRLKKYRDRSNKNVTKPDGKNSIFGIIFDENDSPISNAEVIVSTKKGFNVFKCMTDFNGGFRFDNVPPGPYEIFAQAKGYAPEFRLDVINIDEPILLFLSRCSRIKGCVFDPNYSPLTKFTITLKKKVFGDLGKINIFRKTIEDKIGAFEISNLSEGEYILIAESKGFAISRPQTIILKESEEKEVDLVLYTGGIISGRVLSSATRKPIRAAKISLIEDMEVLSCLSKKDGTFCLKNVPTGLVSLKIEHPTYSPKLVHNIKIFENKTTNVDEIFMNEGAILKGKVVSSKEKPEKNQRVTLVNRDGFLARKYTDEEGYFKFSGLKPGKYMITTGSIFEGGIQRSIKIVGGKRNFIVLKKSNIKLEVEVVDSKSNPVQESFLILITTGKGSGYFASSGKTDKSGKHTFKGLPIKGRYLLLVNVRDNDMRITNPKLVEISSEENYIRIKLPDYEISGTILSKKTGLPLKNAKVILIIREVEEEDQRKRRVRSMFSAKSESDRKGRFFIKNLRPAKYFISCSKKGYVSNVKKIRVPNDNDIKIELSEKERFGIIKGMLYDPNGKPTKGIILLETLEEEPLNIKTTSSLNGKFSLKNVPVGDYLIAAEGKNNKFVKRKISVEYGKVTKVKIRLEK